MTMPIPMRLGVLVVVAVVVSVLWPAAGVAHADEREQLRERFKQRYPTLVQLKRNDRVGETYRGMAGVVRPEYAQQRVRPDDEQSPTIGSFLEEENRDRQRLYELLAEELGTTADRVAERDARRRFDAARPDEWLQPRNGQWVRKRDLP
jgi:uncharacterized protein YdbL (DUF1318 family)